MNNKQPVLVILSPGFPANEADTTCLTSQQNLVKSMNKVCPTLKIIILSFQYPFIIEPYYWHNNKVIPFNGRNKGKFYRLLVWINVWKQLKKIRRENKVIGLLSFWMGECSFLGKYFAGWHHIPHYCWLLGQDAKAGNNFVKYTRPAAAELIALSDFLQDQFFTNHAIKPHHVIPNGIAPEQFSTMAATKNIDVLGVGSLISLKQYELFIETIYRLKKTGKHSNIQAIICGKGPEEKKLQTLISNYSLKGNILLAGELSHPEILRLMQHSKILLHPSSYEGFSTVCLEALYAGAQVISFCKPMKAAIDNWHIVKTPEEILEKTNSLLMNNNPAIFKAMPFSMDDTARSILQLFGQNFQP